MDDIVFACSATGLKSDATYNWYLFSRVDNYAVILREKKDNTEWLFYVITEKQDVDTIWAGDVSLLTYKRPDKMSVSIKKYVTNKLSVFKSATNAVANGWA